MPRSGKRRGARGVVVRRIGVADLSGVLEEECVWRECEVDPDWFTRFTGVKGTIQAELQREYGLFRVYFYPGRRVVKALGKAAHQDDLFEDLPNLRKRDGKLQGNTRAKGAPLRFTEDRQAVLLEIEYPDALVLEVLNRLRVADFQNELNVRIVKGRVKGRDESVNVWYQGLLNEVASAFEFVKLGLAAITGTPKEKHLDVCGVTRYTRQDSVTFKHPQIDFDESLYTLVNGQHKAICTLTIDEMGLNFFNSAPTAGQGLGMIPAAPLPAPVHRPAPPIEQQGQQQQEKTSRSSEYQKQSAAGQDDERKLPALSGDAGPQVAVVAPVLSDPEVNAVVTGLIYGNMEDGTPVQTYLERKSYDSRVFAKMLQLTSHVEVPGVVGPALIGLHRLFVLMIGDVTDSELQNTGVSTFLGVEGAADRLCITLEALKPVTPVADSVLATGEVASSLIEIVRVWLLATPVTPPVKLCLLVCARLLDIVQLHWANRDILFRAYMQLELYTYMCTWHHAKGLCQDPKIYLMAPTFHSSMKVLLEDLPLRRAYQPVAVGEILQLLAEKVEASDVTHMSWLRVLLRNNLARWEGQQEVGTGIRAVLSALEGMDINEPRV